MVNIGKLFDLPEDEITPDLRALQLRDVSPEASAAFVLSTGQARQVTPVPLLKTHPRCSHYDTVKLCEKAVWNMPQKHPDLPAQALDKFVRCISVGLDAFEGAGCGVEPTRQSYIIKDGVRDVLQGWPERQRVACGACQAGGRLRAEARRTHP